MIASLLVSYHDNPLIGGHFAVIRTLKKIQQQFWWSNMKQSVIDHIKSCMVCQAYNISQEKRSGFLHPVRPSDGPNALLEKDFCGPFPTTPQYNKYVVCLTDYFTKFVTAIPLTVCSAQVTAEAIFKDYICLYGVLKAIASDQGSSFKNQLMISFSQLVGYHHILCTPYHPQANGQVERINSTFVTQIAKLTDPYLPTDHPPTAFTFSRPNDYFHQLIRNLEHYHEAVKENILQQQQRSKTGYDHHRQNPEYGLDTTVLTRIFTTRSKLDPKFSVHPKVIIKKSSSTLLG
ncbi:unnamed protein product [Rotaria sp. Silwood2]|nr:unnamed protein product [Rotaria sp. Silwood2]CAF2499857.1 unnamed protein product [Rotaria sp. Silwood2]CAF3271795.1 unnamed protein product [Rotaria sp. Silwood2]CAF3474123.1 unnamed protein product [Rotaria sp. Silwood2]CAF3936333.1 unnamed protein product [Rotaria sp. Silwood2]